MNEKKHNRQLALRYSQVGYGYSNREQVCLLALWTRESRFDHLADNRTSTAFGIAQLLGEKDREPAIQILRGLKYIESRYSGSACKALKHSNKTGWY